MYPPTTICVLMRLCMCPHATVYVFSCYCMCVLMLLCMCPHATTELLVLLQFLMPDFFDPTDEVHMCPHTAIYVSSYYYNE